MSKDFILKRATELQSQMVEWRRDIHANPELGFEETRTANIVATELRRLGMEVEVGVGITGVVGRIGEGGPVVGIRADMDALPIQEVNEVPYASTLPGKMHACGHDAHTAILMGVANILNELPDRPAGEIRFIFQPCEEKQDAEGKSGGTRMIDDKALDGVDKVIALHVSSELPTGLIAIGKEHVLAAVDTFEGTIIGEGAHGAAYHHGLDPIFITAQVINAINGIRARRIDPTKEAVISIGMVQGGSAHNIIPKTVMLRGTIRTFDDDIRKLIHAELEKAFDVAKALGGDYELTLIPGYPSLYNDPATVDLILSTSGELFGKDKVDVAEPIMGGEDFSYMAQMAPGAMLWLGARIGEDNRPHHSPIFDINEDSLQQGAAILAETAIRLLQDAEKA